jgi:hypothetical protein
MAESIKQRTGALSNASDAAEMKKVLDTVLADLTALRASIVGINAKLDLDGGVTGTDFASLWNPAALTTSA